MVRNEIFINSLTFKRYYSNSYKFNNNIHNINKLNSLALKSYYRNSYKLNYNNNNLNKLNSFTLKRYYSNSYKLNKKNNINNKENSGSGTINISNPLDINKNMSVYIDIESKKKSILEENKARAGIYMFTNKITNEFYIGQSKNLYNRFLNYFNPAYLKRSPNSRIGRAILKYGYSKFSLTILEYCDKSDLTAREQYYMDTLNPVYNILKIAGAYSVDFSHAEDTKTHFFWVNL